MTCESELFKALHYAFWMAILLTGCVEAAEGAVSAWPPAR
jgi:hypothetical protein